MKNIVIKITTMKKSILLFAFMMIIVFNASAQLQVTGVKSSRIEIATSRNGCCIYRFKTNDTMSYELLIRSTNQFDDGFWLMLGKTKESASKTLSDLYALFETLKDNSSIQIKNKGKYCSITRKSNELAFGQSGFAGTIRITQSDIEDLIEYFSHAR